MSSSLHRKILRKKSRPDSAWRKLVFSDGERPTGLEPTKKIPLATFIQMSDLHICDFKSPARLEFIDRLADPDNPMSNLIPYVGTYRAQEFLTTQVLEAMVDAINEISHGPMSGTPIDAVVITGDVIDNAQYNELRWYKNILDGGTVNPKSGNKDSKDDYTSSDSHQFDSHYYHPDGAPSGVESNRPHALYGFPSFKGLENAAEKIFSARGLRHTWFAVHGNHDALMQGTIAPSKELNELVTGSVKLTGIKEHNHLGELFADFGEVGPAKYPGIDRFETVTTYPDKRRALVDLNDWIEIHCECNHDHGLDIEQKSTAYWYRNINEHIRLIALDTVNKYGGWQGCIHREQFEWLSDLLKASTNKYVVLTSHHPLQDLFNGYVPENLTSAEPALKDEIMALLENFPNVILWFSGHVHDHRISQRRKSDGSHAFWEIRTGSNIDWPQQSRAIEILKAENNHIVIGTSVIDHSGPVNFKGTHAELDDPIALAGFSRELAANDWQRHRPGTHSFESLEGELSDRNVWLWAPDPLL